MKRSGSKANRPLNLSKSIIMNGAFRNGIIVLALAGLSGCMLGPSFEKPRVGTPEVYRSDPAPSDSIVNLQWWTLFQDPMLDTLVHTALENNKSILIAASRVEEARAALGFTKADQYPRLDLQGNATRGDLVNGVSLGSTQNNFYIAPVLSWELDFWGKYRSATEAARSEMIASEYNLRTLQIGLISDVVSTYFLLIDYRHRLEIARQTLALREESLDIIQKRFDQGIIPEIDLFQARIQREIAAAAIPAFERRVVAIQNGLSILLGQLPVEFSPGEGPDLISDPPEIPAGLPAQLLERRPDVAEAEYRFRAQNARIGVAVALRLPDISLTGLFGLASNDLSSITSDDLGWSVSGGLFGPIFNFGKNLRRVDIEEERTRQALLQYENVVLQAFRDVEDALTGVRTYREQLDAKQRERYSAQRAAALSRSRYDKGVTSYLEVLEAERSLFSVELEYSDIRQQYNNAYVVLYKALGGGWLLPEEMEEASGESETE